MIISDLNYLETVNEEVYGAGGVTFDSDIKKDLDVNVDIDVDIDKDIDVDLKLQGNTAFVDVVADAWGNNSSVEIEAGAQATSFHSEAYANLYAAVD